MDHFLTKATDLYHLSVKRTEGGGVQNHPFKNPEIATKYQETANSYIESEYARKLSKKEADSTSNTTNYIPHHSVVNPNKSGKLRVVMAQESSTRIHL